MSRLTGTICWSPELVGDDVDGWRVLGSVGDPSAEPVCLANVGRDLRMAEVELYESTWYVRVVPVFKGGGVGDWTRVTPEEIHVAAREEAPPTPTAAAVAFVDSTSTARVADEPPTQVDAQPYYQEVIVGPDADRGQVVAEHGIEPAGPLMPDGQRTASPTFALESVGAGATLDVLVRNIGAGGRPGTAVAKTIATPPDAATKFHEIPIVVVSGATHTGLAAPTSTQGWEYDATDGLRLLAFPAVSGMTADWTTILNANSYLSDYVDNAFVESDEIDLGALMTFRLSSSQTVQRKTATGSFATRSAAMFMDPVDPLSNPNAALGVLSPLWVGREVGSDGKARRPIRPQDVQVKCIVSASSGFTHASSDYQPMVEGAWLRGRYVRVALFLREPYGGYQLICPRWTVSAHVLRGTTVGTGSPEAAVVGVPGAHFFRSDGPPHHYVKATGLGNTGWLASNAGATIADGDKGDVVVSSSGSVWTIDPAVLSALSWKAPVRVATTANGTLATAFENGDTVDGITLATGDRILLKNQSAGAENGIYVVQASGAPVRATDFDSTAEVYTGVATLVLTGNTNGNIVWFLSTTGTITVGTTALTFITSPPWATTSIKGIVGLAADLNNSSSYTALQPNDSRLKWLRPVVRLATAAAPAAYSRSSSVITFSAVGSQSVDGSATVLNDRILLKDGAAGADNGIWRVSTKGTGGVAEVWTRASDNDENADFAAGQLVSVYEGTVNADTFWRLDLAPGTSITMNTTALAYARAEVVDPAAAVAGLRTLGTGAAQAAAGNHAHTGTYQPLDADLTAIAALTSAADKMLVSTGAGTWALVTATAAGLALMDDATAADQRTTLGLGGAATLNVGTGSGTVAAGNDSRFPAPIEPTDASTDIVSTSSETSLWSEAIASMAAGDRIRAVLYGDFLNDTGSSQTFDLRVKFGSTTVVDFTTPSIATDGDRRAWRLDIELAAFGTTANQRTGIHFHLSAATVPTTGTGSLASLNSPLGGAIYGVASTEDTTSSKTLEVTVQHSASSASLSARVQFGTMQHLKA